MTIPSRDEFLAGVHGPRMVRDLPPAQRAAHERLAALPSRRHYRQEKDMEAVYKATSEAAARTKRANGTQFKQADGWMRFERVSR